MSIRDFIRYRIDIARRGFSRTFSGRESELTFDQDGFALQLTIFHFRAPEIRTTRVNWSGISRIIASKNDNFTWDSLWLTFHLKDGSECSVSEEAMGWDQLLEMLPKMVPGVPNQEDWWPGVVQPAFAPNVTQIYPEPT
jgi:hypothetical protein